MGDDRQRRRRRARAARRAAPARGRLLARRRRRGPRHRRARPARLPARCASASSTTAGSSRRRRPPSTSSAPTSCASSIPARSLVIDADGVPRAASAVADGARSTRASASSSSSTSPDPTAGSTAQSVHAARVRMGELLAEQAPAEADMVMGVPESGIAAAEGFAKASGIPYGQGLVKNRYIGRSFIAPTPGAARERGAPQAQPAPREHRRQAARRRRRLDRPRHDAAAADEDAARGRRRRDPPAHHQPAGPVAVLLRHRHRRPRRAARRRSSRPSRTSATTSASTASPTSPSTGCSARRARRGAGFCHACFTGEYPVEVPVGLGKRVLEEPSRAPAGELEQLLHEPG